MGNRFASARKAIALCDVCGFQYKLTELKELVVKAKKTNILACRECWSPDQPQLMLGTFPVDDPQAVRNPRPDQGYVVSGVLANGYLGGGSRIFEWGWNPVGGSSGFDAPLTPNDLAFSVFVGTVSVTTA